MYSNCNCVVFAYKKFAILLIPQRAKDAGLHVTIHAGESGPAEHVKQVSTVLYESNLVYVL